MISETFLGFLKDQEDFEPGDQVATVVLSPVSCVEGVIAKYNDYVNSLNCLIVKVTLHEYPPKHSPSL